MKPHLRRLALPGLLLTAVLVFDHLGGVAALGAELAPVRVRAAFVLALVLGWRFRRGRSVTAALGLAAFAELVRSTGAAAGTAAGATWAATLDVARIVAPLHLAWLAWLPEATVASRRNLLRTLLTVGLAALITPPSLTYLATRPGLVDWFDTLPQPLAPWALGMAGAAILVRFLRTPGPIEAGWLGAFVALVLATSPERDSLAYLTTALLILTLAVVERAFSLAFEDGLTGLPGRRALDETLRELHGGYAVAMLDLDHFKQVNDRHGHAVGDQVLRMVARRLRTVGGGGRAFRYGGEEFTVLFPGRDLAYARPHLEALRQAIASRPFALRGPDRPKKKPKPTSQRTAKPATGANLKVTVSIGLAARGPRARPPAAVLAAADRALYRAKRAGRNRLSVSTK